MRDTTLIRAVASSSCQRGKPDSAQWARSKSAQEDSIYTGRRSHKSHKSAPRVFTRKMSRVAAFQKVCVCVCARARASACVCSTWVAAPWPSSTSMMTKR
jgi:hypothetical protein